MNRIDVSQIVDPTIQEPFTGPMLAFLQDATKEVIANTIISLIGPSYSTSVVYILWGCKLTGVSTGPGSFSVTSGAVFFNGEMYTLSGPIASSLSGGQSIYFSAPVTNGAPDPVMFSDNNARNVCNVKQVALQIASSGTQPFSAWVPIDSDWHVIGATGEPAFQHSWAVDAIGGAAARFKKEGRFVVLSGLIAGGADNTVAFTLPAWVQPVHGAIFAQVANESGTLYQRMITISNGTLTTPGFSGSPNPGDVIINWAGSAGVVSLEGLRIPLD